MLEQEVTFFKSYCVAVLKVTVKLFIRMRTGSHIRCNNNMHKNLQQKEKASLCHQRWRDALDGERILQ